jgi:hypothetical protein
VGVQQPHRAARNGERGVRLAAVNRWRDLRLNFTGELGHDACLTVFDRDEKARFTAR